MVNRLLTHLGRLPKPVSVAVGLLFLAVVVALDINTGPGVSFSVFYLLPIFLGTWLIGRHFGIFISIVAALIWPLGNAAGQYALPSAVLPYWNAFVRLSTFLAMTFIIAALKRTYDHEKELARTDYLTGAANGRYFLELANLEISRARRYGHPFTVVYMDADNFKTVNDRFGHSTGDSLLRLVAEALRKDVRVNDLVARLGGDEFAILLPETGDVQAGVLIGRVQEMLSSAMERNNWPVTFSIGAITFLTAPSSFDEMMEKVDASMYSAKTAGKNMVKYEVFEAARVASTPQNG
ncbi:MAG: GGDEF domain-containing protein [Chloroflexi bacterium]|nr:GGDEF domain-containing protein [Chloroflexota bacterium]